MKYLALDIGKEFFGNSNAQLTDLSSVAKIVSLFLNISFVVAGLVILVFFLIGGIGLISSARESPEKLEASKKTLSSAVIGFVVVFSAYWIVKLIQQVTGLDFLGLFA